MKTFKYKNAEDFPLNKINHEQLNQEISNAVGATFEEVGVTTKISKEGAIEFIEISGLPDSATSTQVAAVIKAHNPQKSDAETIQENPFGSLQKIIAIIQEHEQRIEALENGIK